MLVRQDAPLIGRAIGLLLRPLVALYGWWFGFRLWTGTVYVVAPDNIAVMVLFLGGLYIIPWAVFTFWQTTLVALAVAPLVCLSALRIANGQVVRIRLLLCIPYWFTPVGAVMGRPRAYRRCIRRRRRRDFVRVEPVRARAVLSCE